MKTPTYQTVAVTISLLAITAASACMSSSASPQDLTTSDFGIDKGSIDLQPDSPLETDFTLDAKSSFLAVFNGVGSPTSSRPNVYSLGIATSSGATVWNPVPQLFAAIPHEGYSHNGKPSLIYDSRQAHFVLFSQAYNERTSQSDILAATATSPLTSGFLRERARVIASGASSPCAFFDASDETSPYKLYFEKNNATYYVSSLDGRSWRTPVLALPFSVPKAVVRADDGSYRLFFLCPDAEGINSACMARSSRPEGPFVANRSVQVLRRESKAFHPLASSASAGSSTIIVNELEGLYPGQDVVIANNRRDWQYNSITSIDKISSAVQLAEALTSTFSPDDEAHIASVASGKVYPTAVLKRGTLWYAFSTCYDIGFRLSGSPYTELTCMAKGRSLEDLKWSWRGRPILGRPLSSKDDFLFPFSAENMSVVGMP